MCLCAAALDLASFTKGGYCDVCKMAVRYIDGILEQNATEAQIEEAVRKVCNFLPDSVKTEVGYCSVFCPFCNVASSPGLICV